MYKAHQLHVKPTIVPLENVPTAEGKHQQSRRKALSNDIKGCLKEFPDNDLLKAINVINFLRCFKEIPQVQRDGVGVAQ